MKTLRRAAFTPHHHPHCKRRRRYGHAAILRAFKWTEVRAPWQLKTPTACRPSAQGCRACEATLGRLSHKCFPTPTGLRPSVILRHATTPLGLVNDLIRVPRVARPSQPWAERRCPVGANSRRTPMVDRILAAKARDAAGAEVSAWEREIDQLVYARYGLTLEEIQLVEGATK